MRKEQFLPVILLLLLAVSLTRCRRGWFVRKGPSPIKDVEGNTYYTQIGMWIEDGENETTNYSRGWFLPVNSRVKILTTTSSTINVWAEEKKRTFRIVNVRDHTRRGIEGIFDRYFGEEKVDLSTFDAPTRKHITNGTVKEGMSKEAVIRARGYPPSHETASLDLNSWIYWSARLDRVRVTFEDGNVSRVQD